MALIAFRHFPAVAALEEQLRLQSLGLLSDEEAGLLAILGKLPLLNRSPRDRILSYSLMFVMAVNIIVITVMVEALALVVWHVWRGSRVSFPPQAAIGVVAAFEPLQT